MPSEQVQYFQNEKQKITIWLLRSSTIICNFGHAVPIQKAKVLHWKKRYCFTILDLVMLKSEILSVDFFFNWVNEFKMYY